MSSESDTQLNTRKRFEHWHWITIYLMVYDMVAVSVAYFGALLLRFDLRFSLIPPVYLDAWLRFAPFYAVGCVVIFWGLRLYRSIWRFASFRELQRIIIATLVTGALHALCITLMVMRMPMAYYIIGIGFQFILICGIRFAYRFVLLLRSSRATSSASSALIVGAGAAGTLLLRELRRAPEITDEVKCFIDDNQNKWGRFIDGVEVIGGRHDIPRVVERYDIQKIYIAMPSISGKERRKILDICKVTDCELMTLPGMYQLALGKVTVSDLKKVDVEDLLGREPVKMKSRELRESLEGKTVLVTGGGGSIGSEICRQVAAVEELKRLIVFDIYENNAHAIKLELSDKYPDLDLVVLIGSVRNSRRIKQVMHDYRPDIVFHAAAHKHVPLMEDSPCEAIKNNAIGTYYTAFAAMAYGVRKFVLISTDKAVNPVNIMGNPLILGAT